MQRRAGNSAVDQCARVREPGQNIFLRIQFWTKPTGRRRLPCRLSLATMRKPPAVRKGSGMLNVLGAIISGLLVGALARFFYPGHVPAGWIETFVLGIGGSLLAGLVTASRSPGGVSSGISRAGCICLGYRRHGADLCRAPTRLGLVFRPARGTISGHRRRHSVRLRDVASRRRAEANFKTILTISARF